MKVLVCGGRKYGHRCSRYPLSRHESEEEFKREYSHILRSLDRLSLDWPKTEYPDGNWLPDVTIISGGATGTDSAAIDWAVVNWCHFEEYPADWKKHGKAAGWIRNKQMLIEGKPDLVVAFPGGRGTAHMKKIAREAGIEVIEIEDST